MRTPQQTANLAKLANFLDTLPKDRFRFHTWFSSEHFSPSACGTTACALGWATAIPEFGMCMGYNPDACSAYPMLKSDKREELDQWVAACTAASEVFGLTEKETEYLFIPGEDQDSRYNENSLTRHAGPHAVAEHIRDFLEVGIRYND